MSSSNQNPENTNVLEEIRGALQALAAQIATQGQHTRDRTQELELQIMNVSRQLANHVHTDQRSYGQAAQDAMDWGDNVFDLESRPTYFQELKSKYPHCSFLPRNIPSSPATLNHHNKFCETVVYDIHQRLYDAQGMLASLHQAISSPTTATQVPEIIRDLTEWWAIMVSYIKTKRRDIALPPNLRNISKLAEIGTPQSVVDEETMDKIRAQKKLMKLVKENRQSGGGFFRGQHPSGMAYRRGRSASQASGWRRRSFSKVRRTTGDNYNNNPNPDTIRNSRGSRI